MGLRATTASGAIKAHMEMFKITLEPEPSEQHRLFTYKET